MGLAGISAAKTTTLCGVARTIEDDRTATRSEIAQHRVALRKLAAQHRLTEPQLTAEGVVIVTATLPATD